MHLGQVAGVLSCCESYEKANVLGKEIYYRQLADGDGDAE
jgi:hypothetical protein